MQRLRLRPLAWFRAPNNRIRRCRFWRAGNSNLGHDYGNAQFTEEERWALVEYMKAVGAKRVGDRVVP